MNAVSAIEPPVEISGDTPGAMLRRERELRGLTVQQVSDELHLDTWLVEALEENRFLALGAPVYAKGHLRKYAVLLGLPPDLILARYQMIAQPAPPLPPPAPALMPSLPGTRRLDWRRVDWRMYGIIGGLVFAAAASTWLLTRPDSTEGLAPQVAANTADPQPASRLRVPATLEEAAAPSGAAVTTAQQVPAQRSAAPKTGAPTPSVGSPPAMAAVPKAQPRATAPNPAAQQTLTSVPAAVIKPVAIAGAAPDATSTPAPEEVQVSLRLEFSSASWAEVYDGDGKRLLYAIGDPNRARTISGKPPLKVTLGTAGSVQARVNGRPIAIPRRIGQDSSSFTVSANGSIRQPR